MGIDDVSDVGDDVATLSEEQQRAVDELGHRAGAALRRPAPEQGLAGIRRRATTQRLMRGGIAVAGVAALVVGGMVVLGGGDDESDRMIVTNTVPVADPATVPETEPTTVPEAEPTTVPTVEAAPTTAPVTTPADVLMPGTTTLNVASPSSIDMQPHAGTAPALMLVTENGSTVNVVYETEPGGSQWGLATQIRATDEKGTPLVIDSLRSTLFLTIAIAEDGRIVQVDPWHGTSTPWPHPGEVTDVSPFAEGSGPSWPLTFWSVGFDVIDGQRTPVVWYDTGPVADDQGSVTGVPTATVTAVGEPGGTATPLITGNETVAYALLPEPDGNSRLVIVQPDGDSQRTDLKFRRPTATVIGGDRNLWVADRDGLHVVDVETPDMSVRTVRATPIGSLWPNHNDPDHAVLVLDGNGVVASVAGSGDTVEHYRDGAATAMLAYPFGLKGQPQLVLVHGNADEVLIVDLDVFPDSSGSWSWGTMHQ